MTEEIRSSHTVPVPDNVCFVLRRLRDGGYESYLVGGRQDSVGGPDHVYGQSITDACLGWEDSEKLVFDIYREC